MPALPSSAAAGAGGDRTTVLPWRHPPPPARCTRGPRRWPRWRPAGIGTTLRYLVSLALPHTPTQWPASTVVVNLLGAFCLGLLTASLAELGPDAGRRRVVRLTLGVGLLGSFTTYSTLALDAVHLAEAARFGLAGWYVTLSVVGGLLAAGAGVVTGSRGARRRRRPPESPPGRPHGATS